MAQGRWQSNPRQSGPVSWASVEKSVSIRGGGGGAGGGGEAHNKEGLTGSRKNLTDFNFFI